MSCAYFVCVFACSTCWDFRTLNMNVVVYLRQDGAEPTSFLVGDTAYY